MSGGRIAVFGRRWNKDYHRGYTRRRAARDTEIEALGARQKHWLHADELVEAVKALGAENGLLRPGVTSDRTEDDSSNTR